MRIRPLAFRVIAVLLAVGAALAVGEVVVRRIRPQVTMFTGAGLYLPHPEIGHVLRPGIDPDSNRGRIATNSHGFRDREYPIPKPDGAFRIVGIGDSFTFGAGPVENNYLDLLETSLNARATRPVEVLNTGVPAYNTRQSVAHLRAFGLRFDPDLVVLGFFVGNDIEENESDPVFEVVDGELTRPHRRPGRFVRLLNRSHLYRLLRPVLSGAVHAAPRRTKPPDVGLTDFLEIELRRLEICREASKPRIRRGYESSEEHIAALASDLSRRGIDLAVMLIPDEYQVSDSLRAELFSAYDLDETAFDLELPQKRLRAFLERESIPAIDLLEPLRAAGRDAQVYLTRNTHLNRRGNEVAAGEIALWMSRAYPAWMP